MTDEPAASMERWIEDEGIEHVLVEMPDINGISRVKQLSAGSFREEWREVRRPRGHSSATTMSISTRTGIARSATSTVVRAGRGSGIHSR